MWGIIAAIASAILGFGSGSAGLLQKAFSPPVPVEKVNIQACYDPQPDKRITLRWPDNFANVPDRRPQLNPGVWGKYNLPANFTSGPECQPMVMNGKQERTYILVRKDVRIPSCKVDELAGPLGSGVCHGWGENAPELTHRGACSLDGYTDLRKVAEIKDKDGKPLEIFWNPFSYNVGCDYRQDENCGPGQRRNINLKDFVYVLKKREAFDPDRARAGCPVRWDAGATNEEACSHYFDVYMAWDFYQATKSAPATNDPESPFYFVKQVLENCKEETVFIPAPEADLTMPPLFLRTPFYAQNQPLSYTTGKIIPGTSNEKTNYLIYVWGRPDFVLPTKTNLFQTNVNENTKPLKVCTGGSFTKSLSALAGIPFAAGTPPPIGVPTIAPLVDCYDPLGNTYFKDFDGKTLNFKTYTKPATPEEFYFVKTDDNSKIYVYTTTVKDYPSNVRHDPSLQLRVLAMVMRNVWTWATPWCKPAIYLYPEKPTNVTVKLNLDGKLTASNPKYNATEGWNVFALPDGTIKQPLNLTEFPYLYYEADLNNVTVPKEGWIIERSQIKEQVSKLLYQIGFNQKETNDFLSYWLPRLTEKPYYFVTLLPEDVINEKEKLSFSILPDTLIRTRFVFEGLDAPMSVQPPVNIPTHSRTGFTVADWGGTLVGKSCSDVTVK